MAKVIALFRSVEKRKKREQVDCMVLEEGQGIVGDERSMGGPRQVSLIPSEAMKDLPHDSPVFEGRLGENIRTEGILLQELKLGDRIRVGGTLLEITEIGRTCHPHCRIKNMTGKCIIPLEGVFARIIQGGQVCLGDSIEKE